MTAQISESLVLKKEFGSGERPYSERIARLRENFLTSPYEADIERARYYTRSYKQTEGESPCLRAAKGLEETLRHMSIRIEEDERLVGAKTFKKIAGPIGIERSSKSMAILLGANFHNKDVDDIGFLDKAGNQSPEFLKSLLNMPEEMHRELTEEILPYWKGKDIRSKMINGWKKAGLYKPNEPDSSPVEIADMQGHVTAGLKKVLNIGFKGIAAQAAEQLTRLGEDDENFGQRQRFPGIRSSRRQGRLRPCRTLCLPGGRDGPGGGRTKEKGIDSDCCALPAGAGRTSADLPGGPPIHLDDPGPAGIELW